MSKQLTAPDIQALKGRRKIVAVTAYDYPTGCIADAAEPDVVLVGDSLGMVVMGLPDTLSVTMEDMLHHCRCAARGVSHALLVGDLPFLSYQAGVEQAVLNAGRFLKEGDARAVKLEGGRAVLPQVRAIVAAGIPVMGHIGLTPQHIAGFGGFKAQGKTAEAARILLEDARALADAGCFALTLEAVPREVARLVTEAVAIPTIGIGAGPDTDGQVLVFHDLLGLFDRFVPKFVKQYAQLFGPAVEAVRTYAEEVRQGTFPGPEHTTPMDSKELERLTD
ncbi:3-methyl-2-oxobutanoate hydroxymethyltransferase [Desulfovibrio aminophilus]|nr:3-methyl-2-oxobutanoate hydroxymethyltransferase [Desulfovibrio aminophilus]MCM0755606.1 3-methyl-2-oxobutanoate hydroxymethyltransferase [Desulfovibrio aminophilus]